MPIKKPNRPKKRTTAARGKGKAKWVNNPTRTSIAVPIRPTVPAKAKGRERVYRIKPLVWKREGNKLIAQTPITQLEIGYWTPTLMVFSCWLQGKTAVHTVACANEQDAKDAAERWYRQQLRQALIEVND